MFWKIMAPVILVTIIVHHTQTEQHIMAIYGLTWHFLQHKTFHSESSHIQWDETSIAVNQNQCGVCFFHLIFTTVLVGSYLACTWYRKMQYFGWYSYYDKRLTPGLHTTNNSYARFGVTLWVSQVPCKGSWREGPHSKKHKLKL